MIFKINSPKLLRPIVLTIGLFVFCIVGYWVWLDFLKPKEDSQLLSKMSSGYEHSLTQLHDLDVYFPLQDKVERKLSFESDFKGSLVLLNFWASWCEPCVVEMPDLLDLVEKNPELKIVFINEDSEKEDLDAFLKSFPGMMGERTFVVRDLDRKIMKDLKVSLLPESHFYDRDGKFIRVIKGSIDWKTFQLN